MATPVNADPADAMWDGFRDICLRGTVNLHGADWSQGDKKVSSLGSSDLYRMAPEFVAVARDGPYRRTVVVVGRAGPPNHQMPLCQVMGKVPAAAISSSAATWAGVPMHLERWKGEKHNLLYVYRLAGGRHVRLSDVQAELAMFRGDGSVFISVQVPTTGVVSYMIVGPEVRAKP